MESLVVVTGYALCFLPWIDADGDKSKHPLVMWMDKAVRSDV